MSKMQRIALVLLLASGLPALAQVGLTPGPGTPFSLNPGDTSVHNAGRGFTFTVPAGTSADRLEVRIAFNCAADVALYVRYNVDVSASGPSYDYVGAGPDGNRIVVITPNSSPSPLAPGVYYIALQLISTDTQAQGVISVSFDAANAANEATLSSGAGTNFDFGCVNAPTLFNGTLNGSYTGTYSYRIFVPAGSSSLQVRTDTSSGAEIDVYVRAGSGVVAAGSSITADASAAGPGTPKVVNITSTSSPALQPGSWYYVALKLASARIDSGVMGTITATVSGPPAMISVTPASLDFGAVPVGQTKDLPVTIVNSSVTVLKVTAISVSSTQFTFTAPATPFNVAANGQQAITARFQPSAAGPQTANLTITSNDPAHASTVIALTGSGQATGGPAISVSVTSLNFGAVYGSNPPPQTFTVSNSGGGTLNFQVTTSQPWLAVSPASGSSSGAASTITASVNAAGLIAGTYNGQIQVSQSTSASESSEVVLQSSSVTIAVTLTVIAQPGPTPAISAGGIVNAASFKPAGFPGGAIAQGSIFSIFGTNLGPPSSPPLSFPLQTTLAGVQVIVTQGSTTVNAFPLYVSPLQMNALMPSNTPAGPVQITVAYNGRAGAPVAAQVAGAGFGVFTVNVNGMGPGIFQNFNSQSDQPINSTTHSATPGQVVTAWGTGLGPITGPDSQAPPVGNLLGTVEILVGNKTVTDKLYSGRSAQFAGVDQVIFRIPTDAPQGCYVPVLIRVNGVPSNGTTIAIDPNGAPCSDPANTFSRYTIRGGKLGVLSLLRASIQLQLDPTSPSLTSLAADAGVAIFANEPSGEFRFDLLTALPPAGSCSSVFMPGVSLTSLIGGQLSIVPTTVRILDAGPALSVSGPNGTKTIPRSASAADAYFNLLGGSIPLPGFTSAPLYLDPGSYTITGPGGADVGAFTAKLTLPPAVTWTNEAQLATVDRTQGATLTWTGGDPSSQEMLILGINIDNLSSDAAAFLCIAPAAPGSFTVPSAVLGTLPAGSPAGQFTGLLLLGALPAANPPTFTASGLDAGYAFFAQVIATSTVFK